MHKTKAILSLMFMLCFNLPAEADEAESGETVGTVSLERAQKLALEHNPTMKNIGESIYQSEVIIYKAWSILLPNLSANASIILNSDESKMEFPDLSDPNAMAVIASGGEVPMTETVFVEKWSKQFGFSANMPLFNAQSIPLIQNAYDNVDFSQLDGRHKKNELLFAVSSRYYQVRFAKNSVRIARENLENAKEFLRLAQARMEVGSGTKIDVLRAESEVMESGKKLSNAKDSLDLAKTALAYLAGIKGPYDITEIRFSNIVKGDLKALTRKALSDRLDIKSAKIAAKMAERDRQVTWTQWIPQFGLTYKWDYNSAGGFTGQNDSWMLIFGLEWSLLEGGRRIADLKQDASNIRIRANSLEQRELEVREQVERELIEVAKRRRNVEVTRQQVKVAEETHRLVSKQYELGLGTSLDVQDMQTKLSNMRHALELEILQHRLTVLSLNKSVGEYSPLLN